MVKVALDTLDKADPPESDPKGSKPKRKQAPPKSRWLLKLTLFLMAVGIAAPSLISLSGQAPTVIRKINPRLADAIAFRSLTMHWWAPLEISNLRVRDLSDQIADSKDSEGPTLCEADRVTTIEPLWRIAMNAGRGTGVLVQNPRLMLIADEDGTNIDRTVTAIFGESKDDDQSSRFPFRITIENGAVELRSNISALAVDPLLTSAIESTGEVAALEKLQTGSSEISATVSSINGTFSTMDTERWLPEMKLTASINRGSFETLAANASDARKSAQRPTRLAAGLDDLVTDFADVPLDELVGADESGDSTGARVQIHLKPRADEKGRQTIQFGARDVDLRLLQPFLSMMGIAASCDGTISGGIDARLAGASLSDGLVGRLMLQGDRVRIRQQAWVADEWLSLGNVDASGAVAIAEDGLLIQDLIIKSDIAEVTGSGELRHRSTSKSSDGSSQQVEIKGSADIAQLASSLKATLNLHDDVTIQRGRITFGLRGSANDADEVALFKDESLSGDLNSTIAVATNATTGTPSFTPVTMTKSASQNGKWQLVVKTEDIAATRDGKPLTVDSGMRVDAVGPFADGIPELSKARLTANFGTIDCSPDNAAWKVAGLIQPAALWQQLQQFADLPQPGLKGDVSFQSRVAMKADTIQLTDLQLNSSDVKASSVALEIAPSNPLTSMLDGTIHVEGTGAALRTLVAPWHDASWLSGRANVVSDLTAAPTREIQLVVRISPDNVANVQRPNVLSVSQAQIRPQRSHSRILGSTQMTSMESSFVIDEADINLSLLAKNGGQQFEIQQGTFKLPGLAALVTGLVSIPDNDLQLDLTADATYDLDILSRRLFTADSGIVLSGQGRDTFKLTGSPAALSGVAQRNPRSGQTTASQSLLKGSGTVNWASAEFMGLQIGKAAVHATLDNSLLRSAPIQCALNGGELNVMPQYDIAGSRLQLGTGSRVQNLQLTPELCRTWLGYVAPMLADTAEVNGQVSARVERFLWDFNAVENSDVVAQLTIHQAEAVPGSSLSSLLEVVDLLRRTSGSSQGFANRSLVLPEQTVPVQIRQGFVSHDGFVMELSGYRMKTSGAVGLNKQLQMTIDVPLEKTTATSSGRSVKIPLRGSISQPQPDTGALLQNLGAQAIQDKIGGQVDKTLNKQLNKLFDKF